MRHAGTKIINTPLLTLRKINLDDADMMFHNWASDDEVSCYMRWSTHKNVEETESVIQNWFNSYKDDKTYHWGICLDNGEMIGSVGIIITAEYDFKAEVGYCIGRKWWGQGYTSEAVKAVIDYMYANTDIERIEAYHSVQNPASGKVMLNAGMRKEGFAKHKYKSEEGFQDCDLYGIIRTEWEEQNALLQKNKRG
jgi:ribosomal-protein-alanine N-acetyltransferase